VEEMVAYAEKREGKSRDRAANESIEFE